MILKFLLVTILAVCVLERTDARYTFERRDVSEAIKAIHELVEKVKQSVADFQKSITELQEKIKDAIQKADIPGWVNKIQKEISKILEEAGSSATNVEKCLENEKGAVDETAQKIEASFKVCITNIDDTLRTLKDTALDLDKEGKNIITDATEKINMCFQESHGVAEVTECLQKGFIVIKGEVEKFAEDVENTIEMSKPIFQQLGSTLATCSNDIQNLMTTSSEAIVNDFKTCIAQTPSSRSGLTEVIQNIKDIINKISEGLNKIVAELPTLLKQLEKLVNDQLNGFDVDKLVTALKGILDDILKHAGVDPSAVESCLVTAEEDINKLALETNDDVKACVRKMDDETRKLKDNWMVLEDKSKKFINTIGNQVMKCLGNNIIAAIQCVKDLAGPVSTEVSQLVDEMEQFIETANSLVPTIAAEFSQCIAKVQNNVYEAQKEIVTSFQTCISQPESFYKTPLDDIMETIKELINKAKDVTQKIHQLLGDLSNKIQDLLKKLDMDKFVEAVKEKIADILKKANLEPDDVKSCIETEEAAIQELVQETHQATKVCIKVVDDTTRVLKDQAMALEDKGEQLAQRISKSAEQCLSDHKNANTCLNNLLETSKDEVQKLGEEIEAFMDSAVPYIDQIVFDFTKCSIAVQFDLYNKERAILSDFQQCIITA